MAALLSAGVKHFTTTLSGHAGSEPVSALTTLVTWLICTFHLKKFLYGLRGEYLKEIREKIKLWTRKGLH